MVLLSPQRLRFLPWILLLAGVILFVFHGMACAAGDPLGTAQASVDGGIGLVFKLLTPTVPSSSSSK